MAPITVLESRRDCQGNGIDIPVMIIIITLIIIIINIRERGNAVFDWPVDATFVCYRQLATSGG